MMLMMHPVTLSILAQQHFDEHLTIGRPSSSPSRRPGSDGDDMSR